MVKSLKSLYLLFFFLASLFLMETVLRAYTTGGVLSSGLLFSLIFSIPFAIIFYTICTFFEFKTSHIVASVLMGICAVIFTSQMVYYKVFKTFYSLYSAGNGGQILQFWREILEILLVNILCMLLFFLPLILVIAFGKRVFTFEKINMEKRAYLISCIVLIHVICLASVDITGNDEYSPYDLYYNTSYPILSTERLGLLTTMRLDLQRLTFGWSPAPVASAFSQDVSEPAAEAPVVHAVEKKIEYNTMDIDFAGLLSTEKDKVIQDMHKYFQGVQPTAKNDYTGKYKGYNLILITAESFSPYAVRQDLTPTLYKLVHEGYYFTNFYNPVWAVSTSDGEYVACTSLIPKPGTWSFRESGKDYMAFTMGNQLQRLGYKTMAYHNHTYTYYKRDVSHPNMGYTYKGLGNGLDVEATWPESDLEMMEKTIPEYISSVPFHTYYMTVSGHLQYSYLGNAMALKNKASVENLPFSEQGKAYIGANIELDKAMEYLLSELDKAGTAEKTLIALSADHYPFGLDDSSLNELAGHSVEQNFELYSSPFILYTKGMTPVTVDRPCSSLDILPTLSNLLGLSYDSRLLMGRDIFSDSEPLVIFQNKSFITDKGRYNSATKEFIPVQGATVEDGYVKKMLGIINNKFYYSAKILDTDYYSRVLQKK